MVQRSLVVFAAVLALSWAAVAQMRPGGLGQSLQTGTISGMVRTGNNQPAPDVRIEVRDLAKGQVVASTYTLPNGSFEIMNVPAGPYEIHAMAGLNDAMERVDLTMGSAFINLRLPTPLGAEADSNGSTVSVAQFRVPAKARSAFHKAELAMEKNKLQEAEKQVEKALGIFPDYADALTLRALLRMDSGRIPDAIGDLRNAIKDDPGYALAYVVMGAAFNQTSKFDDAIRTLQRGISLNPASWQAYFELGKSFVGKGDFTTAMRNLNRAQQMAPDNYAPLHLVKAHAWLGMNDYAEAMGELEAYLQKEPNGQNSVQVRQTLAKVKAFVETKK